MEASELSRRYPVLYHMAADGSWDSISAYGLLSTTALLDLFDVATAKRRAIEENRRPDSVVISHPDYGTATIRDNKPLLEGRLTSCLQDGMTPGEWYQLLNRRVFFWPTRERLQRFTGAAAYRDAASVILTINTQELLAIYGDSITLSYINSGATAPFAWPRGRNTFRSIAAFDWEARRHRGKDAIAELAVDYSVPEILAVTDTVVRRMPSGVEELIWQRSL
jgi:hypothetical protein